MNKLWFPVCMGVTVTTMLIVVERSTCGVERLPLTADLAIGIGSAVVAGLGYLLAKLEDRK